MSPGLESASVSTTGSVLNPGLILEGLFASAVLFVATGAVFPLLRRLGGEGSFTVNVDSGPEGKIFALAFGITTALLYRYHRELRAYLRQEPALWVMPVFAIVSVLWSSDPSQTVKGAIWLVGSMLFGAYLALRFDSEGLLQILAFTFVAIMMLSVAFVFVDPGIGIDRGAHAGVWRGVFGHKNLFGRNMAFAFAVFATLFAYKARTRPLATLFGVSALVMVWLSESRTSLVVAAVMVLYILARPIWQRIHVRHWFVAVLLLAALLGLAMIAWSERANLSRGEGGADTLTGRTLLWAVSLLKVAKHPALGYGYNAFWGGKGGEYMDVWQLARWPAPNAHNAFLDLTLDLGLVGLGLFLFVCVRVMTRTLALQRMPNLKVFDQVWPGAMIAFALVAYMTEGQLLLNHAYWMLFTAAAVLSVRLSTTTSSRSAHVNIGSTDVRSH